MKSQHTCPWWCALLACVGILTGCIEHELPIPARPPGDAVVRALDMGSDYGVQLHVDLASGDIVAAHPKSAWCLRIHHGADTVWMDLNSSRLMQFTMLNGPLVSMDSTTPLSWEVFSSEGRDERNALSLGQTWALDLGRDPLDPAASLGFLRMEILEVGGNSVRVRVADLYADPQEGLDWDTLDVAQDPLVSNTHVSLLAREVVDIEPHVGLWDVYFTQFTALVQEEPGSTIPPIPYLVTGVLSHSEGTQVMQPQEGDWDDWIEWTWPEEELSSDWDVVGFDWKLYDLDEGSYEVNPNDIYGIRTADGREFLLRFLDFYDDQGNTGRFTYEILER